MLPDGPFHGLLRLSNTVLHPLNLPFRFTKLLLGLLELIFQRGNLILQALNLLFEVSLDRLFSLDGFFVGFLDLRDCIGMILFFLRNLLVEVGVELGDELLVRLAQFLDLLCMFSFQFLNLISMRLAHAGLESLNLSRVGRLKLSLPLFKLSAHLL